MSEPKDEEDFENSYYPLPENFFDDVKDVKTPDGDTWAVIYEYNGNVIEKK